MAISRLLTLEAEGDDHLGLALFHAFDAKVNAEITQGVGYNWDAEILIAGKKAVPLRREMAGLIEGIFRAYPYTPLSPKQWEFPKNWQRRLESFCDHIMCRDTKPRRKSKSRKSKSKP